MCWLRDLGREGRCLSCKSQIDVLGSAAAAQLIRREGDLKDVRQTQSHFSVTAAPCRDCQPVLSVGLAWAGMWRGCAWRAPWGQTPLLQQNPMCAGQHCAAVCTEGHKLSLALLWPCPCPSTVLAPAAPACLAREAHGGGEAAAPLAAE